MNGFLLDTNIPSELIRPQPEARVRAWIASQSLDTLFISVVSFGELRKGIILRSPGKRRTAWLETDLSVLFSGRILPVARSIADTALEHDLTLVTRNARDFEGLGVSILNPWEQP